MAEELEMSAWEETGNRPRGTVVSLTPRSASSLATTSQPGATFADVVMTLTPALQLCAPVGMQSDDKDTWFEAAFLAIGHLAPHTLREAVKVAMRTADHPSKIVPAIIRATDDEGKGRYQSMPNLITPPSHRLEQQADPNERAKVAQTMGQLLARMKENSPDLDALINRKPTVSG